MSDKPEIIHRSKFMDGQVEPDELHRRVVLGGKRCDACRAPAAHHAITFAPLAEILNREGVAYLKLLERQNGGQIPMVKLRSGASREGERFVRIGVSYACDPHFSDLQRSLAKGPSWVLHEIDPGMPEQRRTIVGVR